jgi:flagellar biosynthesis activator protein FlaF
MPPSKQTTPNNPYAAAAGAYGTNAQKNAADPREVEARVLLKSAQFMVDLQKDWDNVTSEVLQETLKYNRNIWMMFYDTAIEDTSGERPKELVNNIFNLANFIFKREIDIMAKPEKQKLDILISINRDIAAGLMDGVKNTPMASSEQSNADTKNPPSDVTKTDQSA